LLVASSSSLDHDIFFHFSGSGSVGGGSCFAGFEVFNEQGIASYELLWHVWLVGGKMLCLLLLILSLEYLIGRLAKGIAKSYLKCLKLLTISMVNPNLNNIL
jgi:hypothetical protein